MERVAIIGAGPAGLITARYLKSEGFDPMIYERAGSIGGQWSGESRSSGIWPGMRTNTSRILTAFSDLPHPSDAPTYLSSSEIGGYLRRFANAFELTGRVHLRSPVRRLQRRAGRWTVTTDGAEDHFAHAVVACGRYQRPALPAIAGLESFTGIGGLRHTFEYRDPSAYRGHDVLVLGGAISALEIASDLAMLGARRVVVAQRRQRYVLPKLAAGIPTDHLMFTRYHALALESLSAQRASELIKTLVLRTGGDPARYGAPRPDPDLGKAGLTLAQHYLPLVAEGRIEIRSNVDVVEGETVRFDDGRVEAFDAILCATGYVLELPFLDRETHATLDLDREHIDLYRHTFHPDLPGLAFAGCFDAAGPNFPPLEQQARWIAYTFSGAVEAPHEDVLREGVAAYRARRGSPQKTRMDVESVAFARAAGVLPDPAEWPELARALLFGPLTPVSFRLSGRDRLPDAPHRVATEAAAFDCMTSADCTQEERRRLRELSELRGDPRLIEWIGGDPSCPASG